MQRMGVEACHVRAGSSSSSLFVDIRVQVFDIVASPACHQNKSRGRNYGDCWKDDRRGKVEPDARGDSRSRLGVADLQALSCGSVSMQTIMYTRPSHDTHTPVLEGNGDFPDQGKGDTLP